MLRNITLSILILLTLPVLSFQSHPQPTAAAPDAGPAITSITTNLADYPNGKVPLYAKFELTLNLDRSYTNPFDPQQISLEGQFTPPGAAALTQPGFYFQDYQVSGIGASESYSPVGSPLWKVRFTPRTPGIYQYTVRVTDSGGTTTSGTASFEVVASTLPGFIGISAVNNRYFEFDNGNAFIGLGLNVPWWQNENRRITAYSYYLDRMHTFKANLARVWMTNSGIDQNWILSVQDDTLGSSYNLEEAWALDYILDLAQQQGVYFLLTLDDVNQYVGTWADNLYNSAQGGPAAYRSAIFTSADARIYQQRIFRYIIARWGYSPNILSWELFNEIDELQWSDTSHWSTPNMIAWHRDMAAYIQSIDAHGHLVNTSTGSFKTHPNLYGAAEMGFAEMHFYYVSGCCDYAPSDPAGRDMADLTRYYAHLLYNSVTGKPAIIGEWGILDANWNPSPLLDDDESGVSLHNGSWSALMSGMAATGLSWHWSAHQENDPAWWQHYTALANYFNGVQLANLTVMKPLNVNFSLPNGGDNRPDAFSSTNASLRVMGLRSGNLVYAWIQNKGNTWWNHVQGIPAGSQTGTISVLALTPGMRYRVQWWDTYASQQQIISNQVVTAGAGGSIQLQVSSLATDVAIQVRPVMDPQVWVPLVCR